MEVAQLTAASSGETMRFEVRAGEPATLGRSSQCSVKLRDPKVSRVHCQLTLAAGRVQVLDLDSSQGLVHRGLPSKAFELEIGDGFHLGTTFVRFEARTADPPAAGNAPTPTPPPREPDHERPRAAPLAAGTRLGRFTLGTELGRGARCTVHRAQQDGLERPVALKVLDVAATAADFAAVRAAFLASVHHGATLQCPFLVSVLDGGEADGTCFAALELVRGTSLASALGSGRRLPWARLLPVLVDVTHALSTLHAAGLGHGAVTAGNVFVRDHGGGLLADARHDAPFDPTADLRALAAVSHLALTGEPPPSGLRAGQRLPSLRSVDASLPVAIDRLLGDLLVPPPDQPAPSANAVREQLLAAATPAPAPPAAAATAPRVVVSDYPDIESERARPARRPTSTKAFAARLVGELIVFSIVLAIAIATLVLLKKAAGFDLYALFGV